MAGKRRPLLLLLYAAAATAGLVWAIVGLAEGPLQLVRGLLPVLSSGAVCFLLALRWLREASKASSDGGFTLDQLLHVHSIENSPEGLREVLEDEDRCSLIGEDGCRDLWNAYARIVGPEQASKLPKPWEAERRRRVRPVAAQAFGGGLLAVALAFVIVRASNRDGSVGIWGSLGLAGGILFVALGTTLHAYALRRKGKIWTRRVFGAALWAILLAILAAIAVWARITSVRPD